jgi:predicted dehydrogenase
VVLELSHEIDYVCWLIGEVLTVNAQIAKISDLKIETEDSADIFLKFKDGTAGNIHMDMVQRASTRTCKLIGVEGTLIWDGITNSIRHFSAADHLWHDIYLPQPFDRNEMFLSEINHFLDCVKTGNNPLVTGQDGLKVLKIALAVKESALEKRTILLGDEHLSACK